MNIRTVNRLCSSGLLVVADVAAAIKVGFYDIGKDNVLVHPISFLSPIFCSFIILESKIGPFH